MLFMKFHVIFYRLTLGMIGGRMFGMNILLLTTVGRKSGVKRTKTLAYFKDGDNYAIVASAGGQPNNPAWYHNLKTNPEVEVQIKSRKFKATAKDAPSAKKDKLWKTITGQFEQFQGYQDKVKRIIPVVILTPQK